MITRIEVDGFKSLRNFAVDLEPFTVFIGPNSAGKSNILEALGLLSRLAEMPIVEAFKGGRGRTIDQFTRTGTTNVRTMKFAVEFFEYGWYPPIPAGGSGIQSRFRYELTIHRQDGRHGTEKLSIEKERLLAMSADGDTWMTKHAEFVKWAGYSDAGTDLLEGHSNRSPKFAAIALPGLFGDAAAPIITLFEFRLLHIDTVQLGRASERTDVAALAHDASNLPSVLAAMQDTVLGAVRAHLVALVPGIASFEVVPYKDEFQIEFQLSDGGRIPAHIASEGTLRILALLTALLTEPPPAILGIEEPENGVFPGRLRALLDTIRRLSEARPEVAIRAMREIARDPELPSPRFRVNQLPTQILLTTHSPVVLSTLMSELRHLRFVDTIRRDGERVTRARTVGPVGALEERRFVISPREIEALLDTAYGEAAE